MKTNGVIVCCQIQKKMFWTHYANPGELLAGKLRSCWLGREGVPVETKRTVDLVL